MAAYIGIDLGTTYSMVSYLDDTGRPKIIRNAEGQSLTPSCIEINGDEVTVGEIDYQYMDFEKVFKYFSWTPSHNIQQGLEKTISWYKHYLSKYYRDKRSYDNNF